MRSARVRTAESFSFRYGRVEVRAKLPRGDWLWPAIWMLPSNIDVRARTDVRGRREQACARAPGRSTASGPRAARSTSWRAAVIRAALCRGGVSSPR